MEGMVVTNINKKHPIVFLIAFALVCACQKKEPSQEIRELLENPGEVKLTVQTMKKVEQMQNPEPFLKELRGILKKGEKSDRLRAVYSLSYLKKHAEWFVPTLKKLLKDKDEDIRQKALESLVMIWGIHSKELKPVLENKLGDPSRFVRAYVQYLYYRTKNVHTPPKDLLYLYLNGSLDSGRKMSFFVEEFLNNAKLVKLYESQLRQKLDHRNSIERHIAAKALTVLEPDSKALRRYFDPQLDERTLKQFKIHLNIFPGYTPADFMSEVTLIKQFQKELLRATRTAPKPIGRIRAATALRFNKELSADILPGMLDLLDNKNPHRRSGAIRVMGGLEGEEEAVVEEVLKRMEDKSYFVRAQSLRTLSRILRRKEEFFPKIMPLLYMRLEDPHPSVRSAATSAFMLCIRNHEQFWPLILPVVIKNLKDTDPQVRSGSLLVIGNCAPKAIEALPALVDLLKDPQTKTHIYLASTFGRFGQKARIYGPDIVDILRNDLDNAPQIAKILKAINYPMPADIPIRGKSPKNDHRPSDD